MAKKSMIAKANGPASTRCRRTTAAPCAAGRAPTCDGSRCAASASGSARSWASCPASRSRAGRTDEHLRPDRGHAHARPERVAGAPHRGGRAGVAHQARDRPHPQGRGLHRRRQRGAGRAATVLRLQLKYVDGKVPVVSGLKRISKPGLRVYARKTDIPRVLGGLGIVIVSTSQGIMTGQQARQAQLGGEVLAYVW